MHTLRTNKRLRLLTGRRKDGRLRRRLPVSVAHFDSRGCASMVDVSGKEPTARCAVARCEIWMRPETFRLLSEGRLAKGDAFTAAKVAAILAAKRTAEWIPLCHTLPIEHVDVRFFKTDQANGFVIETSVRTTAKTGVEMEALTAASAAALTLYDMVKGYDPGLVVTGLRLIQKTGGKSDCGAVAARQSGGRPLGRAAPRRPRGAAGTKVRGVSKR